MTIILSSSHTFALTKVLIMGDSLSAGYGIQPDESWVYLLTRKAQTENLDVDIINASVSGASAVDGLNALPDLLARNNPNIVILALGSNDGLRGQPILQIRMTLGQIISKVQDANARVLLIGLEIPPNYGKEYSDAFAQSFPKLSAEYNVPLVPFLMAGFETNAAYFQPDHLHPTAQAQEMMFNNVWPYFEKMVKQ